MLVGVDVDVLVGVCVGVLVGVLVIVGVGVIVGVAVGVLVGVGDMIGHGLDTKQVGQSIINDVYIGVNILSGNVLLIT